MPRRKPRKGNSDQKGLPRKRITGRSSGDALMEKSSRSANLYRQLLLVIMFIGIAGLLLIGPFYRGLFFTQELLVAQAVIFFLLLIWGIYRLLGEDSWKLSTPLDIFLFLLFFAYLLSFIDAAHKREALEEIYKIAAYIAVYLISFSLCRNFSIARDQKDQEVAAEESNAAVPQGLRIMLHLAMLAATLLAVASLGVPAGHWDFIGAYFDAGRRIASPMGYSNTAAAYFMAAYFLVIALGSTAKQKLSRSLYLIPAALILITTILTFSRGAWLLLPPLIVLLVLAAAPGQRLRSLLYMIATIVTALPAAFLADSIFRSEDPVRAWIPIMAAVIFAFLSGLLFEYYLNFSKRIKVYTAVALAVSLLAVMIIAFVLPLFGPILLHNDPDSGKQLLLEQVIETAKPGENYQLSFDYTVTGKDLINHQWGVRVVGGLADYQGTELASFQGSAVNGQGRETISFQTTSDTTRLEVQLYNASPGLEVQLDSVMLRTEQGQKQLRFVLDRILPDRFYDRIFSRGRDRNMEARLEMFRDALLMIKDHPLVGTGGGGWAALYQSYQSKPYFSTEVHNHYLQVWIEAGLIGFIGFLGLWLSMVLGLIRNCFQAKAPSDYWQHWTAVFMPVAALGAHSLIDWNFSLAAVGIYLFVLLGAGRSMDYSAWFGRQATGIKKSGGRLGTSILVIILALVLFATTLVLNGGFSSTARSQAYIEQGNIKQAVPELRRAINLDPLRAENYHNLGVITEEQANMAGGRDDLNTIIYLAEQAYSLEHYNPLYIYRYGQLMLSYVDLDQGLAIIDRLLEVRPLSDSSYIQAGLARLRLAEYFINSGNPAEAGKYLDYVIGLEEMMEKKNVNSDSLAYLVGRAWQLKRDQVRAKNYYLSVSEEDPFYEIAREQLLIIDGAEEKDD